MQGPAKSGGMKGLACLSAPVPSAGTHLGRDIWGGLRRRLGHAAFLNRRLFDRVRLTLETRKLSRLVAARQEDQGRPKKHNPDASSERVVAGFLLLLARDFRRPDTYPLRFHSQLVAVVISVLQR